MKKLFILFCMTSFSFCGLLAQTLKPSLQNAKTPQQKEEMVVSSPTGKIRINPASKFNVAPEDVEKYVRQDRNNPKNAGKKLAEVPKKIDAAATYPDSLYVYTVLDSRTNAQNPWEQGQVIGFYAVDGTQYYKEMDGKLLPEAANLGSNNSYVRVEDKWYVFDDKLSVYDANTGAMLQSDITYLPVVDGSTVIKRPTGVGYDLSSDNFYVPTWSGILEVKRSTFESALIGNFSGFPLSMTSAKDGIYYITYAGQVMKYDKETQTSSEIINNVKAIDWSNNSTSSSFDFATGNLYYNFLDSRFQGHMAVYDASNNSARVVMDFPESEVAMSGLYIPYAKDNAPAAVSDIHFADGQIHFTAPTKTYASDEDLTGLLTAYISVNGGTPVEVSCNPGGDVARVLALMDGSNKVSIQVGNTAGKSPERVAYVFNGEDTPAAPTDVSLTINPSMNATLTWNAPQTSEHFGPVNDNNIVYDIVRYPDNTTVASDLQATSFTETLTDARKNYYYTVTAKNIDRVGGMAQSNVVPAGSVWYPPYTETFYYEENFDIFKIIDNNNDQCTWKWTCPLGDPNNAYAYMSGNGVTSDETGYVATYDDDYLVTPSIYLKAGNDYRVRFEWEDLWMNTETMEILLGRSQNLSNNETEIEPTFTMYPSPGNKVVIFNVPEDGLYNIFFHVNTVGNSINVTMDNLSISLYASFEGPDSVTNLTATAGAMGALSNTVTFNTPTQTYHKQALSNISYINIYRNGSENPVHVFDNPAVGEQLSWTDTDVENGSVTYRVVPFNASGQGKEAFVTNWVGLDIPADIPSVHAHQELVNGEWKAVVTYERVAAVGAHGGYVVPEDVEYVLCRYNEYAWDNPWPEVTPYTNELTLTDTEYYGYGQQYVDYLLVARNAAGTSAGNPFGIVIGEPYTRPYTESFPYGYVSQNPWTLFADSYYYAWNIVTGSGLSVKPYDGDGGMLQFTYIMNESNTQVITGPRVSLVNSTAPELSFYMYHGFEAEPEDLNLIVYLNYQDEGWDETATIAYNNGSEGWSRYSIPLRTDSRDIQIAFGANAVDASAAIYMDAIKIDESTENDLAAESISLSEKRINAGSNTVVTVGIANYGTQSADNYNVVLYRDGELFAEQSGTDLAQNAVAHISFPVNTTKADASQYYIYHAVVRKTGDTNEMNDTTSSVRLYVKGSILPSVTINGSTENGVVELEWVAPAVTEIADASTDDFESYESFIIDAIGDWQTYDGDGTPTVYFGGPTISHAYEPKAWQVWAPEEAGFSLERFEVLTPHSGDKYLACWAASDGSSSILPNDDWLISSDVLGGTDVSFYYRVPNAGSDAQIFEMMYSITDQDPASFICFDRDSVEGTTDWVHFEYTLPANAKYFALRSCSKGSYTVAFLDDITYTPLYGSTTPISVVGYNVYRDDQLLAGNITSLDYTDFTAGDDEHVYNVTVIYAEGESNYSNSYVSHGGTGIEELTNNNGQWTVKTSKNMISVCGLSAEDISVYNTAGQQVYSASQVSAANIYVGTGIYLVRIGDTTRKVIVE